MHTLIEASQAFVAEHGLLGLFLFSFTEAFINPVPVSPVLAFAILMGAPIFPATLITFIANILGGMVGFFLGKKLGHPVCVKLFGAKKMGKAEKFFLKYAEIGVFLMAFTPLPFKVATWAAGVFEMRFGRFLFAALIGRAAHFGLALAATYFGWAFFSLMTE